jgi:hypothetical protein
LVCGGADVVGARDPLYLLWTGRSRHPDPTVDSMPDYENQHQDLVW